MVKVALEKIIHGLLVGTGFAVAVGAVLFGYTRWEMKEFEERTGDMPVVFTHYSPAAGRNFKVSCSDCRDVSQPLVYDRYTIAIASANYVRPEDLMSNKTMEPTR